MDLGTLGWLFTVLVFGALGSSLAKRRSRRAGALAFVVLLVVAAVGYSAGISTRLVSVFGFDVRLSWAVVACCGGAIVGLARRNRQLRRPDPLAPHGAA